MDEINMKGDPALLRKIFPDGEVVMSVEEFRAVLEGVVNESIREGWQIGLGIGVVGGFALGLLAATFVLGI